MRVAQYLFTTLIVLSLNFFLPRMIPGDPLSTLTGDPSADMPILLTDEIRGKLLHYYGLDRPLGEQYILYLRNLARGDLGWSIYYKTPVAALLWKHLRWTLLLMGSTMIIYLSLGSFLGVLSAWHRGSKLDTGLLLGIFGLGSWPSFFTAMLLIIFFSVKLNLFPIGGATSIYTSGNNLTRALDIAHHLILPSLALVIAYLPSIYFLTRNATLSALGENYIRTARAKGLSESLVLWRHTLPNVFLPLITMIAMRLGFLVMGAITVEVVFSYPGMGTLIVEAFAARDYPVLQGAFLLITMAVLCCNLMAEILYNRLDPRVKQQ
ncbi:MAG: ABC transporter permease [Anaerolineae bacterium]|nr:ABC transporter permease [Anaerolineae bacterium]